MDEAGTDPMNSDMAACCGYQNGVQEKVKAEVREKRSKKRAWGGAR